MEDALPPIDDVSSLLQPPDSPLVGSHLHPMGSNSSTGTIKNIPVGAGNAGVAGDKGKSSLMNGTNLATAPLPHFRAHSLSLGSSKTDGRGLDHLDTLGAEAEMAAARIRRESLSERSSVKSTSFPGVGALATGNLKNDFDDDSTSHGTLTSQSQRFLLEAFLGDGTESLILNPSQRERLGSFDARIPDGGGSSGHQHNNATNSGHIVSTSMANLARDRDRLGSIGGRRDRLESWGGMSDLSHGMGHDLNSDTLGSGGTTTAAALAATIYTSLANDITAAADGTDSVSSYLVSDEKIPTKIAVNRDRLNSVASMATEASDFFLIPSASAFSEAEYPSDVQKFVQAAMASVGDQLADLANAVEAASSRDRDQDSEISSTVSPLIGAASDVGSNKSGLNPARPRSSSLTSVINIAVDYDAVAAAVDAAQSAAYAIDLASYSQSVTAPTVPPVELTSNTKNRKKPPLPLSKSRGNITSQKATPTPSKNQLPKRKQSLSNQPHAKKQCVTTKPPPQTQIPPIPRSNLDERDMEKIRERARAAAGYVPPSGTVSNPPLPPKKRSKLYEASLAGDAIPPLTPSGPRPHGFNPTYSSSYKTPPVIPKYGKAGQTPNSVYSAPSSFHSAPQSDASKGQSSQKWDAMFDCLLNFIDEMKKEETDGLSEQEKKEWSWDGNVPTTFKTSDGKALGRWVNNQRSAKSKGALKDDREKRLVDAGLKWSVLACNSWNEMLEELRIYIEDQVKEGKKWDGNGKQIDFMLDTVATVAMLILQYTIVSFPFPLIVPTNYRIKVTREKPKTFIKDDDEDKNLGRWVNRQRSQYQAGKLRKDRQLALEQIGLKWSMLATTSWESMFDTLCEYVEEKTKDGEEWDGNVPANHKTEDNPPRALGRWINRQRSAFGKDKLKSEYVAKLNEIGLKWSVHERRPAYHLTPTRPDNVMSNIDTPDAVTSTVVGTKQVAPTIGPSKAATPTILKSSGQPAASTVVATSSAEQAAMSHVTATTTAVPVAKDMRPADAAKSAATPNPFPSSTGNTVSSVTGSHKPATTSPPVSEPLATKSPSETKHPLPAVAQETIGDAAKGIQDPSAKPPPATLAKSNGSKPVATSGVSYKETPPNEQAVGAAKDVNGGDEGKTSAATQASSKLTADNVGTLKSTAAAATAVATTTAAPAPADNGGATEGTKNEVQVASHQSMPKPSADGVKAALPCKATIEFPVVPKPEIVAKTAPTTKTNTSRSSSAAGNETTTKSIHDGSISEEKDGLKMREDAVKPSSAISH